MTADEHRSRILVIEDNGYVRDFLQRILRAEGYTVSVAGDGPGGVAMQSGTPSDMVITDLDLPREDAAETVRDIRKLTPDAKIIALCDSSVTPGMEQEALRVAGVDGLLKKPFEPLTLITTIHTLLHD
jgi:CheY-like chemotaxis protein